MEVRTVSKEDMINYYRSADMLYAQTCKQPDPQVFLAAQELRDSIGTVIIEEFKLPDQESFDRFIYMVN